MSVCLRFQEAVEQLEILGSRYRNHDYSAISLIPFPDSSLLSPGGDTVKGRDGAEQDNATGLDVPGKAQGAGAVCTTWCLGRTSPSSGTSSEQTNKMYKIGTFLTLRWSSYNGEKLVAAFFF